MLTLAVEQRTSLTTLLVEFERYYYKRLWSCPFPKVKRAASQVFERRRTNQKMFRFRADSNNLCGNFEGARDSLHCVRKTRRVRNFLFAFFCFRISLEFKDAILKFSLLCSVHSKDHFVPDNPSSATWIGTRKPSPQFWHLSLHSTPSPTGQTTARRSTSTLKGQVIIRHKGSCQISVNLSREWKDADPSIICTCPIRKSPNCAHA